MKNSVAAFFFLQIETYFNYMSLTFHSYVFIQEKWKHAFTKRFIHQYSYQIFNSQNWKQPKYPLTGDWINQLFYIYAGILFSNREE